MPKQLQAWAAFALLAALSLLPAAPGLATSIGVPVPKPTATGQHLTAAQVNGILQWSPVLDYQSPDNVHFTFGGGTLGTGAIITANVVNTADGGLRINLPSGATGNALSVYSSTGALLFTVSSAGVLSASQGVLYNEIFGLNAKGGGAVGSNGINTAFGFGATAGVGTSDLQNCAFGYGANATNSSTALGAGATASVVGVAIGLGANAQGANSFALGRACSTATGNQGSIAVGFFAATNAPNQMVLGSSNSNYGITQTYIGDGVSNAVPDNTTLNATGGSGTNIAGANITIAGGQSTGTGAEGTVYLATSGASATSGTVLNTLTSRVQVSQSGLTVLGTGTVNSPAFSVGGTAGLTTTTQVTTPTGTETLHFTSGLLTSVTTP